MVATSDGDDSGTTTAEVVDRPTAIASFPVRNPRQQPVIVMMYAKTKLFRMPSKKYFTATPCRVSCRKTSMGMPSSLFITR